MSEGNITEAQQIDDNETQDEEPEAEVISIKRGKLLKLRHDIEALRAQFKKETEEVIEWKMKTSETTKTLIGELNDNIKREGSSE